MDPMIRTSQTLSMAPLWAHQAPPLRSLEMFPSMGSLGHPFTCASPCRWGSVDGAWSCPNWSIWGKKESPESNTSMIVIPGLAFDWFQSCDTIYDNISSLHDGFGRFWPPLVLGRQRTIQLSISGVTGTFSKATARRDGTRMGGFRVWPAIRSPHGQAKRFGFEVFLLETLDWTHLYLEMTRRPGKISMKAVAILLVPKDFDLLHFWTHLFQLLIFTNHCFHSFQFPGWRLVCLLSSLCGPQLCNSSIGCPSR